MPDAPIQQTGTVWTIRAPRDAWHLLNSFLIKSDIDRYREAAITLFCIDDPSLELPPEERWLANIKNKELPHSHWLRRGLAQTLVHISLMKIVAGCRGADLATSIVHELLRDGWKRWYALAPVLPHLAEAAPTTFLTALEQELAHDPNGIDNLFEQQGSMTGNHATGLLSALELLAWYPEHLTRTTLLLGTLARKHQRIKDILRAVFLTWLPQTCATIQERNAAISVLLQREPKIAWDLLLALWPKHQSIGSYHYRPQWREKPVNRPQTIGECDTAALAIIALALRATNNDSQRLADLIKHIAAAPSASRATLRDQLETFAKNNQDPVARTVVWNALREETSKHRHLPEAEWTLPEAEIAIFDPLVAALKPADPLARYAWLFMDMHPMLPMPDPDHTATEAALVQLREQAAKDVAATYGVAGIRSFAITVAYPFVLGMASASTDLAEDEMLGLFADTEERAKVCSMGYVSQRYQRDGMVWVDRTLDNHKDWSADQRACFFLALPNNDRRVWARVNQQGATKEYWSRTRVFFGREATTDDITDALINLLAADQTPQALEQASMAADSTPTRVLTKVLDSVCGALDDTKRPWGHTVSYDIARILNALDQRQDIDPFAIARYEWMYLPLLRHERQLRLHEHLANAPELFAEMITSIYRPANKNPTTPPTEQEIGRAQQAYELLTSWNTIPGMNPDGTINEQTLITWAENARQACSERRDACDNHLGEVLAYAPVGSDGAWPHESIRTLIERVNSRALENGFHAGIFNKRGVSIKNPLDGGEQERALATQYRTWAQHLQGAWPRTAATLAELADDYEQHAHHEDTRAEQLRLKPG